MSVSSEESCSLSSRFRDALPSVWKKSRNTQIWGTDLEHTEWQVLEVILEKFLGSHSALPALQLQRAIVSLQKTLEWRRVSDPKAMLTEAGPVLSDLNLCRVTLNEAKYVLWITIDEMEIKRYSTEHPLLTTSQGLIRLGLAVMEKLSTLLLHAAASPDLHDYSASCVIEFMSSHVEWTGKELKFLKKRLCKAPEELATFIRYHYPNILGKAYIINPREDYLAPLDIDETLLRNTVLLKNPEELAQHLGPKLQLRYGGTGESFSEFDLLHSHCSTRETERNISIETSDLSAAAMSEIEIPETKTETTSSTNNTDLTCPEGLESEGRNIRLIYSEAIGPPSMILDPVDLQTADDLFPDKMGARIVFADSDTVVKFGHGVRLAEAEALNLASTRTTIAVPRLLSAYILDGVGYIVMSYEPGEPLHRYWDHASKDEQNRILEILRDYVNQMREIPGDFIGGIDGSPCRDGIFEAGLGDYTKYSYGPYPSEERFDEGIIQALRDRIRPEVLEREHDIESNFFNSEYMLYQTVRGLKSHKIVFTHGDLHTGNIIVRSDGTVVLVDWGLAGFWPEYWEFYRAMHSPHWRASWGCMVEKFIPPFYVEYHVMKWVFGTVWN